MEDKALKLAAGGIGCFAILMALFYLALGSAFVVAAFLGVRWLWMNT